MQTDFRDRARIMSADSLLDFAERGGVRGAIANAELRERIRRGDVDDMPYDRAVEVLGGATVLAAMVTA
jgi:hypothetical protein